MAWHGMTTHSDPFVRVSVENHGKAYTAHKSGTVNPKYNQVFSAPCEAAYVAPTVLISLGLPPPPCPRALHGAQCADCCVAPELT